MSLDLRHVCDLLTLTKADMKEMVKVLVKAQAISSCGTIQVLTKLRKIAEMCDYGTKQDEQLRDEWLMGC